MDANKTGAFIKELRTSKNLTQKDLAEIINCTDKAISRWETGRGLPEVSLLIPLSKALDISVNELLSGEKYNPAPTVQLNEKEDADEKSISVPEIISKTDETIVSVIIEKDKEIKRLNTSTIIFMVLCCVQILIFFVIPELWSRQKGWDAAEFLVFATMINSVLVGSLKGKIKWIFPVFGALILLSAMLWAQGEDLMGIEFVFWFAVLDELIIAVCSLIRYAFSLIIKKIRKLKSI